MVRLEHEGRAGDGSGFRRSRNTIFGRVLYLLALQKPGDRFAFAVCRPNTGASYFDFEVPQAPKLLISWILSNVRKLSPPDQ